MVHNYKEDQGNQVNSMGKLSVKLLILHQVIHLLINKNISIIIQTDDLCKHLLLKKD